jgi:hypothetical protein
LLLNLRCLSLSTFWMKISPEYKFARKSFGRYVDTINWGPFLTSPIGANFDPQGRSCPPGENFVPLGSSYPLGVKFSVCSSILLNSRECSPLGVNEGVNIPPRGHISSMGAKFTPGARGEVKNGPLIPAWRQSADRSDGDASPPRDRKSRCPSIDGEAVS